MGNPVQLTEQQFQQLLAAVARPVEPPAQGNGGAGMVAGAASIVGEMPHVTWEKTASEDTRNGETGCKMPKTK